MSWLVVVMGSLSSLFFGQGRGPGAHDLGAVVEARARGDEVADDDVLFEPAQGVDLPVGGRVGEDAGGLLERGRRDEGLGGEGRLGDAEQYRLGLRRLALAL